MQECAAERKHQIIRQAIRLFHRRWSVPVVAVLAARGPLRFVALLAALGASRDTLTATLASLIETGVVERVAAADGNWLSYALTPAGEMLARACAACVDSVRELGLQKVALKKWPMVLLVAVGRGQARYNALKAELPGITPRALASALKDLEQEGLVAREVQESYPPIARYQLTPRGCELLPALEQLVDACEALDAE